MINKCTTSVCECLSKDCFFLCGQFHKLVCLVVFFFGYPCFYQVYQASIFFILLYHSRFDSETNLNSFFRNIRNNFRVRRILARSFHFDLGILFFLTTMFVQQPSATYIQVIGLVHFFLSIFFGVQVGVRGQKKKVSNQINNHSHWA